MLADLLKELKRAREENRANQLPPPEPKRVAVSAAETNSIYNSRTEITNLTSNSNSNSANKNAPTLPTGGAGSGTVDDDDLLDYDLGDLDDMLDGFNPEEDNTLVDHTQGFLGFQPGKMPAIILPSQPQQKAQQQSQDQSGSQFCISAVGKSSAAATLAKFAYQTPVRPQNQRSTIITRDVQGAATTLSQYTLTTPVATTNAIATAAAIPGTSTHTSGGGSSSGGSPANKIGGQVKTIERTLVEGNRHGGSASSRSRNEIPGPAGTINTPAAIELNEICMPTQRPTPAFKTPLSRRTRAEQASEADFEGGTWAAMVDHLNLPAYTPRTAKRVQDMGEIGMSIRQVLGKVKQTQKVSRMLVQIRDVGTGSEMDASAVVVDPTGEMEASIHAGVLRDLGRECTAGTSVILDNVVVMVMPGALPFLVITIAVVSRVFTVQVGGSRCNPIVLSQTQPQIQQSEIGTPINAPRRINENNGSRSSAVEVGLPGDTRDGQNGQNDDILDMLDGTDALDAFAADDDMLDILDSSI
ncbi:hypothetical protein GGF37_002497 [Kickxella alabastrina]|nr:hypothetical protein GGF37_002497 [Kickxella alabastrina]